MENQQTFPALRPLHLGELLDQAIRLYRRNFLTFVGIIALVYVPLMILQTAATALMTSSLVTSNPSELFTSPGYWIGILSTYALLFFRFVLVQGFATGAMTRAVADDYLGKPTGILDAYRGIGKSWLSLLGALLLILLFYLVASIWFMVPCAGWFTGLGMMAFLLAAINPLMPSIIVLEGQGAFEGLQRAWSLARRRFWPVLGYVSVLYIFSWIVVSGPSLLASFALTGLFSSIKDPVAAQVLTIVIQSFVGLIGALIYYPLQMVAFTLIYLDLRVRTEGFDIALATMDRTTDMTTNQIMTPPPAVNERFLTGQDFGNFAILTLVMFGLVVLYIAVVFGGVLFGMSLFG